MKHSKKYFYSKRGSALMVVMIIMIIMSLLTASMLSFSASERRQNEFNRLVLRTRNMVENSLNYGTAQLKGKIRRINNLSPAKFSTSATGHGQLHLPPAETFLKTPFGTGTLDLHAGLFEPSGLTYIDPRNAAYASNPYQNLSVIMSKGTVIGKSTLTRPGVLPYTAYAQQDLFVAQIPIFQFLAFYNMDMEFGPGGDMILDGPIHANGDLCARMQYQRTNTLQFKERVTCTGGFYADVTRLGAIYNNTGTADENTGGTGNLRFQNPTGTVTNINMGTSSSSVWRDHTWSANADVAETESSVNKFKEWATNTYAGNLRTSAHDVSAIELPGVQELADGIRKNAARVTVEPPMASDNAELVNSKFSRRAGLYIVVNPTSENPDRPDNARLGIRPDGVQVLILPNSYRCWLNYIDTDGIPHPIEVVLPGQPTYGDPDDPNNIIVNDLPNRFTNMTAIGSNQVIRIPIPTAANTTRTKLDYTSVAGTQRNVIAWMQYPQKVGYTSSAAPTMTSFPDGIFYDLRRAISNDGYPDNRPAVNFLPRPITKIDFDMTRFRLAVERTMYGSNNSTNIYNPDVPTAANWANNVLNPNATRKAYPLGIRTGATPPSITPPYTYTFPLAAAGYVVADPFKIYRATRHPTVETPVPLASTDLFNPTALTSPWFDGIAVYIHSVDAEDRSYRTDDATRRKRTDSGVRLWNGRGPVVSLAADGRTGMSLATNDALYIIGHLNADGTVNSTSGDTSSYGGYSARYPDNTEERLCNVMADAITVLSQPVFSLQSGSYVQTGGWCDALSAHRFSSNSWSSNWQTTNPSSSNQYDGIGTTAYTGNMPYYGYSSAQVTFPGTNYFVNAGGTHTVYPFANNTGRTTKFSGANTEISSCLLVGLVATRSTKRPREKEFDGTTLTYQPSGYQNSGGVHNFPRLLEDWTSGNAGLYLRTSMVAMFQSEVACEPWLGTRIYSAPGRYWGLHQNLRAENAASGMHDVPLEPTAINISRWHYSESKPANYDQIVSDIEALPLAQ